MTDSEQIVLQSLLARLSLDSDLGVDFVALPENFWQSLSQPPARQPAREAGGASPAAMPRQPAGPVTSRVRAAAPSAPPPRPDARATLVPYMEPPACPEKEALLAPLREQAERCDACELCRRRTHMAWGEGDLNARVMFIGEAPGRDEDLEGRPFVGRSGCLLTDIIEKGMKIPRSGVYIANVVKCRPPGNRDPRPEEVAACSRYLERQLEVIAPEVIVAVGGVAGCALLGLPPRTPGLRGKWHQFRGLPLRVIYHPSYLLRQRRSADDRTEADRATWQDIREVMARLA